jgi:hypothetical protein
VDFLRKRLPARVGRYLEGLEFPAQKEELLGRLERNGVPGPLLGQLRERLSEGEFRAPRTSWWPCDGGVSLPPGLLGPARTLSTGELLRTP